MRGSVITLWGLWGGLWGGAMGAILSLRSVCLNVLHLLLLIFGSCPLSWFGIPWCTCTTYVICIVFLWYVLYMFDIWFEYYLFDIYLICGMYVICDMYYIYCMMWDVICILSKLEWADATFRNRSWRSRETRWRMRWSVRMCRYIRPHWI